MLLLCNFQVSILVDLAFPPLFYFPFTVVYINEITAPIFFNLTFLYFLLVMVPLQNVPLVFRPRQRLVEPLLSILHCYSCRIWRTWCARRATLPTLTLTRTGRTRAWWSLPAGGTWRGPSTSLMTMTWMDGGLRYVSVTINEVLFHRILEMNLSN